MQHIGKFSKWVVFAAAVAVVSVLLPACWGDALAHDSWISRGGLKNAAGEWCCGAEDCGVLNTGAVTATAHGYSVRGMVTYEPRAGLSPEAVNEVIPFNQALPSPDGAYWRCKRPDGSPRCFFAPPPGS